MNIMRAIDLWQQRLSGSDLTSSEILDAQIDAQVRSVMSVDMAYLGESSDDIVESILIRRFDSGLYLKDGLSLCYKRITDAELQEILSLPARQSKFTTDRPLLLWPDSYDAFWDKYYNAADREIIYAKI